MKNTFTIKGIEFEIGRYTPRNNEFEKGLKYKLFVGGYPTSYCFSTKHELKNFVKENYFIWL